MDVPEIANISKNGKPGKPGYTGGNLIIITDNVVGSHWLLASYLLLFIYFKLLFVLCGLVSRDSFRWLL